MSTTEQSKQTVEPAELAVLDAALRTVVATLVRQGNAQGEVVSVLSKHLVHRIATIVVEESEAHRE